MTNLDIVLIPYSDLSTHILTRRMTMAVNPADGSIDLSTHILTRRMTTVFCSCFSVKSFQLTSSQGGWRLMIMCIIGRWTFNSHPHKEDDILFIWSATFGYDLSTHILTRRMTLAFWNSFLISSLSTHILTRRMTQIICRDFICNQSFNSHPHKEDDQGGAYEGRCHCLSTHILTRRMTKMNFSYLKEE